MRVPVTSEAVVMVIAFGGTVRVPRVSLFAVSVVVISVAVRPVAAVLFFSNARAHAHDLTSRTLTSPRAPNQEQRGTILRGSVA